MFVRSGVFEEEYMGYFEMSTCGIEERRILNEIVRQTQIEQDLADILHHIYVIERDY